MFITRKSKSPVGPVKRFNFQFNHRWPKRNMRVCIRKKEFET